MKHVLLAFLAVAGLSAGQARWNCSCGANPPGPPAPRETHPYASTPEDMRPFGKFTSPYKEHYVKLVEYNGGAREVQTLKPSEVDEVRIGFLGPVENHPDEKLGRMMLNGAQLAIDEANAGGGYGGKPFKLMVHNDQATWGASSNEIVKMTYDEKVWAIHGSISGDSTHIALRASLKTEVPIVNSAATDPTIPETVIPWYLTTVQDDREQGYTLARRIYTDLKLQRIALLRVNDRYGRFGVGKFKDASRRLGHPVVIEQKYLPYDTDFARQLRIIQSSDVDGIVLWGDAPKAAIILKQMREAGMKQRVFGSFRVMGDEVLAAGDAANGLEVVVPYDPTRDDPAWVAFNRRFEKRFGAKPDAFASLAYDTMNILLQSICKAGLNRGLIRDALTATEHYRGVTGDMTFDPNCKNVVPMFLATVKDGKASYRRYTMDPPYDSTSAKGASYNGPATPDLPPGPARIVLFGPNASGIASELNVPKGRYVLAPISSEGPWGQASAALVNAVYDGGALAVIALDRDSSHLAEQLGVKAFVPVIGLSNDRALTSVNIPWMFRMPAGANARAALAELLKSAEKAGPNRAKLREALQKSGAFDASGEPIARAK